MAGATPRLGLIKPTDGEEVDVDELNGNSDKIDAHIQTFVCTSTTRPGTPWVGLVIFETDTFTTLLWNGTRWSFISGPPTYIAPTGAQNLTGAWAEITGGPSHLIKDAGHYRLTARAEMSFSVAANVNFTHSINFWLGPDPIGLSAGVMVTAPPSVLTRGLTIEIERTLFISAAQVNASSFLKLRVRTDNVGGSQAINAADLTIQRIC